MENVIWLNLLGRFVVKIGLRCFEPCFVAFDYAYVKTEFDADPVSTVVGGTSSTRTPCVGGDNLTVAVSDTDSGSKRQIGPLTLCAGTTN